MINYPHFWCISWMFQLLVASKFLDWTQVWLWLCQWWTSKMLMSVIFEYTNSNKPFNFGVPNYTAKPYVFSLNQLIVFELRFFMAFGRWPSAIAPRSSAHSATTSWQPPVRVYKVKLVVNSGVIFYIYPIYIYTRIYVYNQQWHGVESLKHGILAKIYVTFRGYKWLAWLVDCWVNGLIPLCCRYLILDVGYEPTNQLTNQKPPTWITDQANPSKARKEASKQATSRASQARPSDPNHTKYRNQATSQLLPLHWLTKCA
jgi:hypothetical protein